MRSLRVRFFLIVWPLVVAMTIAVGWYFSRWTRVELRREMVVQGVALADLGHLALPDSAAALLGRAGSSRDLRAGLDRFATLAEKAGFPSPSLFLLDSGGRYIGGSGPEVEAQHFEIGPNGMVTFSRSLTSEVGAQEIRMRVGGQEVPLAQDFAAPEGIPAPVGVVRLYVMPEPKIRVGAAGRDAASGSGGAADRADGADARVLLDLGERADGTHETLELNQFIDRADRTVLTGVLIASLIAAIATWLLAQPVVGRAGRLARAARGIRGGDLSVRVPTSSTDELGDVESAFNDMAQQLEQSEALKRRMVSDVAHELRTPLTNLVGTLEAVEDGLREPDSRTVASLREEVGLLERLVEDLQEIAVADAGGLRLDIQPVDLLAEAERSAGTFRSAAEAAAVSIHVQADGVPAHLVKDTEATPPYIVQADRGRLGQVFRNLLRNAITHSPPEGEIRVVLQRRGGNIDVAVQDQGKGIPTEHLDLIWERFYRVEDARDRGTGGIGLGLAIVKRLVEAQEGRVWAENRLEGGASLHFTLRGNPMT